MANKKNNYNGLVIFGIFAIAGLAIIGISMLVGGGNKEPKESENKQKKLEAVRALSPEQYPASYDEVLEDYYLTYEYLYGGECLDEEVTEVIEKQRMYFAKDLLNGNPLEQQIAKATQEVADYREKDIRVIQHVVNNIYLNEKNVNQAFALVTEYGSGMANKYVKYVFVKEGESWKIYGWYPTTQEEAEGK